MSNPHFGPVLAAFVGAFVGFRGVDNVFLLGTFSGIEGALLHCWRITEGLGLRHINILFRGVP